MKQKILLMMLFIVISMGNSLAQQLKTHKGEIYGGEEAYTYYIDTETADEVRQGSYNFIKSDKNSEGATSVQTIKGQYVKGYKNGAWLYSFKNVDVENGSNNYVTITITMTMTYKDGMPNGAWNYSSTGKRRSRKYALGGWSWGQYVTIEPTYVSTSFKDGVMIGNVSYSTPWVESKGKLDDEGWLVGQWRVNKQGLMVDFVNGVNIFDPKDKELTALQRKVAALSEEEREDFCFENDLTMEIRSGKNFFDLNDGYFDNGMWLHRKITGDKTYKSEDGLNYKDTREYGKYIVVDRKKFQSLSSINSDWKRNSSAAMRKLLDERKGVLSRDDQQILTNAIMGREIMENILSEYGKTMEYYRTLKKFKTSNNIYISPHLLPIYNKIETYAKSCCNLEAVADTLRLIDRDIFSVTLGRSDGLQPYSVGVDYGSYLEKIKQIAPALNTIPDSLNALTSLHTELANCSKVTRSEFSSNHLKTLLTSLLRNYIKIAVAELDNTTSLSGALSYAKTMSQAISTISDIDELHSNFESSLTKSISIGYDKAALFSTALSSKQNMLLNTYYTIAEQVLGELASNYDYTTLSDLYKLARKVESLRSENNKELKKQLKKEIDARRQMQIILAQ